MPEETIQAYKRGSRLYEATNTKSMIPAKKNMLCTVDF